MKDENTYTAFEDKSLLFKGALKEIVSKVKKKLSHASNSNVLIFSDLTGKLMDFNFHGTEKEVLKRIEVFVSEEESKKTLGPGRPKLGVLSREVSLLPRHWEWLATQTGGASVTLRKLVEEEMKKSISSQSHKLVQEKTYKVMSVLAGDFKGYEEALRALYKKDEKRFLANLNSWPNDIRNYVIELSQPLFS